MSLVIVEPKRGADVGRVVVEIVMENHDDTRAVRDGRVAAEAVRRATCEALVDTGATYLCLPARLVRQLALTPERTRRIRTANGAVDRTIFSQVMLHVQGRECPAEVLERPDDSPPLLGQLPLESMDWWVDFVNQQLVGNPEHDGE